MKNSPCEACLVVAIAAISCIATALAQDTNSAAVDPAPAPPARTNRVAIAASQRLPYGVDDVLNLSRARISEDVIVDYIRNTGTAYSLGPREIVLLRDEGVSDHVITTMLDQRKKVAEDNTQQAVQQATQLAAQQAVQSQDLAAAPVPPVVPVAYDPNIAPPYPPFGEPCVEDVQPPASSLYIIPYGPARAAFYGSSYYGLPYYGYGVGYPVYYGAGGSFVYRFGARGGCGVRHGGHGGSVHVSSRR